MLKYMEAVSLNSYVIYRCSAFSTIIDIVLSLKDFKGNTSFHKSALSSSRNSATNEKVFGTSRTLQSS